MSLKEIEKLLAEKKKEIDNIEVPEDLESRLYAALENRSSAKTKKKNWKTAVTVAFIVFLLIGYNFNALAYYGKKLLGYDNIMNGTLKHLNELGKGQPIGKSYTFNNGVTVILDGIMIDENQLLAFYTVRDPDGAVDEKDHFIMTIRGFIKEYSPKSGQGEMNEDKTEIKWIHSFEKPSVFDKTLKLELMHFDGNNYEKGEISFSIDPNKAMGHTLKQAINKTVKEGDTKLHLESILASPTKTVIQGKIQNIIELAKDKILGERLRPIDIEMKLIANGEEVEHQGGDLSTDMKGIKFHKEYDALPDDLTSLQIKIESFSVDRDVNTKVEVKKDLKNLTIEVLGQDIVINQVYELGGSTYIAFTTRDDVVLTKVELIVDGERIGLKETINSDLKKLEDGTILHTRTMCFPKTGSKYELTIEKMTYKQDYNKIINIPLD